MGMFDRLIVGVDGSDGSRNALRWASAQARGSEVIAVHGFSPGEQLIAAAAQISLDGVRADHESLLCGPWTEPASEFGVEPKCELYDDSGANSLMIVTANHGSGVIVVGHQGHTGWSRHHVGSTTAKLLHRCDVPLIIISPDTKPEPIIGPIVVGISGTADLESAHLAWAAALAGESGLRLNLVGVHQPPSYFDPSLSIDSSAVKEANASSMRSLVGEVRSSYPKVAVRGEVRSGLATAELAAAAADHSAGMVVLGNHHPSLAAALLSGSILRHLPSMISCPMAAIPATWRG